MEQPQVRQELRQFSDRHRARYDPCPAVPEDRRPRHQERERHQACVARVDADGVEIERGHRPGRFGEPAFLVPLCGKRPHDPHAHQVLLQHGGENTELLLDAEPDRAQAETGDDGHAAHYRHERQADKPEPPVDAQQQVRADADQEPKLEHPQHARGDELPRAFDVDDPPRHQVPGVRPVMEAEAEPLELLVEGQPELVRHLVADRLAQVLLDERERPPEKGRRKDEDGGTKQRAAGSVRVQRGAAQEAVGRVDRFTEQPWDPELETGAAHNGKGAEEQSPLVAQRHADDAP